MGYDHDRNKGRRLNGWEDLNAYLLARDLHLSPLHVRNVLTGRSAATTTLLGKIARKLGIKMSQLVDRIERAHVVDMRARTDKAS